MRAHYHTLFSIKMSTAALYAQTNNIQTQERKELIEVSPLADVDLAAAIDGVQVLPNEAHR